MNRINGLYLKCMEHNNIRSKIISHLDALQKWFAQAGTRVQLTSLQVFSKSLISSDGIIVSLCEKPVDTKVEFPLSVLLF